MSYSHARFGLMTENSKLYSVFLSSLSFQDVWHVLPALFRLKTASKSTLAEYEQIPIGKVIKEHSQGSVAYASGIAARLVSTVNNLDQIAACGYDQVGHFALPEETWWIEYYGPLEARVQGLRQAYAGDREALALLDREQREIDLFKRHQRWYGSAFFVMQRSHG